MSVFDRMDFTKDGKKMRENKKGKFFKGCLVGRGREKKKKEWLKCFFPELVKKFSPQNKEKVEGREDSM